MNNYLEDIKAIIKECESLLLSLKELASPELEMYTDELTVRIKGLKKIQKQLEKQEQM
jgi:hypothetical protein